jgi:Ca-activated chloride channel family protein
MRTMRTLAILLACALLAGLGCSDGSRAAETAQPGSIAIAASGGSGAAMGTSSIPPNPAKPSTVAGPTLASSGMAAAGVASGGSGAAAPRTPAPSAPEPSNATDSFKDVGTNPFVAVEHDPFSTFAADVDTASYDLFRRDVQLGMLPQPASVRLEEYVNYFAYDYEAPEPGETPPFQISLGAAPNILDTPTTLLRVWIAAQANPAYVKRAANVVFLVDISGSMNTPDKLPVVQVLLDHTIDTLDQDDTVAIVTYASGTSVALEPTRVAEADRIRGVIAGLQAAGSTAGAAGLDLAYAQAQAGFKTGGINHIILCTDGDFNVGPSSTKELLRQIKEKRTTGVTLTAVGFGIGNLNDAMMEAVSDAGNGIHAMVSDADYARRYAEERMLSTLVHVAKDMKIQVEFNPQFVAAYRLLGYENRAIADDDFRDDSVDAGEVGAGHRVTALYELVMAGDSIPMPDGAEAPKEGEPVQGDREIDAKDLVLVKVRYKDVNAGEQDAALEVSASLPPERVGDSYRDGDANMQWATAVAAFAEILKQSPYANRDYMGTIETIVSEQAARDEDRTEFAKLFALARDLLQ